MLFMYLVLLVINPIIVYQAAHVAVGGVCGTVHVPGAASNQSYYLVSGRTCYCVVYVVLFMYLVLLVINPFILYQAALVAVCGVHDAVHVPGAANN